MDTITLFYQGEGVTAFEDISVSDDATVEVVIARLKEKHGWSGDDWFLFVEDEDSELDLAVILREHQIKHRHRVHVHRCKHIQVTVTYNNESKQHAVSPSTTVGKIKEYFIKLFTIDPVEAPKFALWYGEPAQIAGDEDHIGKFASHNGCSVSMDLAPKTRPQG